MPALANLRCPARSVSQTKPTGTRLHSWSVLGSAEVTPLMRVGMPADHDAGRTGDLPVSAEVRRLSRSGRSPPHCRWGSADPDLGAPALSPAQDDPWRGTSCRACQSRRKRGKSHPDARGETLPAGAPALPGMPALGTFRCPARSVRRTGPTGTRQRRPARPGKRCSDAFDAGRDACAQIRSLLIGHVPGLNGTGPGYSQGGGHGRPGSAYAAKTRPR